MEKNDITSTTDELLNLNLSDIKFKKIKEADKNGTHLISYSISNKEKKRPSIQLNNICLPFGPEKFNNNTILNIEIDPKKSNVHYNYKAIISGFETEFTNRDNFSDKKLLKDIDGKGYYPNLRESKEGFIIRSYIFSEPEVFSMMSGKDKSKKFKNKLSVKDTVGVVANINLELGTLWINENNYGLLWYVKKVEVLHSI